jgi:hypothetical protein
MKYEVLSTTKVDGRIEYVIKNNLINTIGTYRLNEGYGLIVGRNSYGLITDIFEYIENEDCLIVDPNTNEILLEPVKARVDANGYIEIECSKVGYWDAAHRVVAFSYYNKIYLDGKKVDQDVDHINGNKQDNRPENLQYTIPLINQYRAAKNKYNGAGSRFISELRRVFKEENDTYINYACQMLIQEL